MRGGTGCAGSAEASGQSAESADCQSGPGRSGSPAPVGLRSGIRTRWYDRNKGNETERTRWYGTMTETKDQVVWNNDRNKGPGGMEQ